MIFIMADALFFSFINSQLHNQTCLYLRFCSRENICWSKIIWSPIGQVLQDKNYRIHHTENITARESHLV